MFPSAAVVAAFNLFDQTSARSLHLSIVITRFMQGHRQKMTEFRHPTRCWRVIFVTAKRCIAIDSKRSS